jgi:3-oxoacyl-[acyl-carrier protein] reductase
MNTTQVAIVTGGTRGMGADISLALAERGDKVLAVYRSNDRQAKEFLERLQAISPESQIFKADVSKKAEVNRTVEQAIKNFGRIDILVNNAGIFDFKFVEEMEDEFLDNIMTVNFKSQYFMTKACLPHMKKNNYGRILNASSISGALADVGLVAYGASKAAVDMMTKICAAEFGPYNITVNAYAPGIILTDMTAAMINERGDKQVKQIPLNRFGKGEEVAALIKFLSSPEAGYITGIIIGIDGGMCKVQNAYRAHEFAAQRSAG